MEVFKGCKGTNNNLIPNDFKLRATIICTALLGGVHIDRLAEPVTDVGEPGCSDAMGDQVLIYSIGPVSRQFKVMSLAADVVGMAADLYFQSWIFLHKGKQFLQFSQGFSSN